MQIDELHWRRARIKFDHASKHVSHLKKHQCKCGHSIQAGKLSEDLTTASAILSAIQSKSHSLRRQSMYTRSRANTCAHNACPSCPGGFGGHSSHIRSGI